jgi:phosphatidylglycerophosphate synthase
MLKKGATLGARLSGKVKTVGYIVSGSVALLTVSFERLSVYEPLAVLESFLPHLRIAALVIFAVSVVIAILSFFDYVVIYKKAGNTQ